MNVVENINSTSVIKQVIALFEKGMDTKEVAKKTRFADHRQMANFMKSCGYLWDAGLNNYILAGEPIPLERKVDVTRRGGLEQGNARHPEDVVPNPSLSGLIQFLEAHKEKIQDLVENYEPLKQLPRFIVPGVYITKSVHMNQYVDQLTREYSEEKNITQRDICEVALIEFFKKYGYQDKVSSIMR